MRGFQDYLNEFSLSLQYHQELNPALWDEDKVLKEPVRDALLKIANTWAKFANIPQDQIIDIVMSGGNANFNYTPVSDIDVHIIVDKDKLSSDRATIEDNLLSKKTLWGLTHNIKIRGYEVEVYAQDVDEKSPSNQGEYSLLHDEWIKHPENLHLDFESDSSFQCKVQDIMDQIDHLIESGADVSAFDEMKDRIKKLRVAGLQKGGEFSQENLIFKELRNQGYLDKMNHYTHSLQDSMLSLE